MIAPMLADSGIVTSLEYYINNDDWLIEQKLDGHRLMLRSPDGLDMGPTALTRGGNIYTRKLPASINAVRFPTGEWILDGELVGGTYWVFDILAAAGQPLLDEPLSTRRIWLEHALQTFRHPFRVVPQAATTKDKIRLAERSLNENCEGLVLKRAETRYRYGIRSHDWLKVKYTCTADVIALAVRDDGKESVKLGVLDDQGQLVEIGRASLIGKEKHGAITPGQVLEVRYLYTGAGGRLYQPTILRPRSDKAAAECRIDQLKAVNKSVLESL